MVAHSLKGQYLDGDSDFLSEDDERVVRRGWRLSDDGERHPALFVAPVAEYPSRSSLDRLQHEYDLKEELDAAWAVRPLQLVRESARTILVLQDPGGAPLERLLGAPMEVGRFLGLAIGIAVALGKLHQRGLVHKDIKPANILANDATGAVHLTGFGIASRLARERLSLRPPETLAGTLAYMAPEQTGRMNRSLDSRTDLYALGVTFYQMLTGVLPFTASAPMEWVHCHLARRPVPPAERLKGVPGPISAIVMKLLAKRAEDRYQTAAGLDRDLRRCLGEWEAQRQIGDFPLGERDIPDRLLIPEKLYGRQREVETLLDAFDRIVKGGAPELILVSGYSGIGKSSVVNELQPMLVPPRALFKSGKFDQHTCDVPYSTLAQAFQSLIRLLLAKSEVELAPWRDALREALGSNAGLMADLVPELKLIIGAPPPIPDLPPQDAQRRFRLLLRNFIGVFARQEHPLALFLDDLQWLDAATLDLLEDLVTRSDLRHLLLIGAYRDNEVNTSHPLVRRVEAIRNAGGRVTQITLGPLRQEHLEQLVADTLRCDPERSAPFARLVHEKTAGNPFFTIQFIASLAEEGLLTFDHGATCWSWDLDRIRAKRYTDNVVDLMLEKLNRLPGETQTALQQLACLGRPTEITTLTTLLETSEKQVHALLWEGLRLGLIEQLDSSYRFIHDRAQEAAYSLIPEASRTRAHLRIGRLLAAHVSPEKQQETVFDIVNHLNRGMELITSREERDQLADLNLIAGRRAKASTAYVSALKYLNAGAALLGEHCWERKRDLTFSLELERAECEFRNGEMRAADERSTALSSRAGNTLERAAVACLQMGARVELFQLDRAVAAGLDYLRQVGIEWSPHPTDEEVQSEYEQIQSKLGSRAIESVVELPLMTDPESLATAGVLIYLAFSAAICNDENLNCLAICKGVNLCLERGNCDAACYNYVVLSRVAIGRRRDYKTAFRFGQVGIELMEAHDFRRFQARTYVFFADLIVPWVNHVRIAGDLLRRALDAAEKVGDVTFANYANFRLSLDRFIAGDLLSDVQGEAELGPPSSRQAQLSGDTVLAPMLALIRTLRGLTPKFGCFDCEKIEEASFERLFYNNPYLEGQACWYWLRKMVARYFAGDYVTAMKASSNAQSGMSYSTAMIEEAEYHFYSALSHAALCDPAMADARAQHLEALWRHQRQLESWAENCAENFENRSALVGAEIARLESRDLEAMRLYEKAISSSRKHGFVNTEGLAYERASVFYRARGFDHFADIYLRNARACYATWGADGKVRQLDQLYPGLKQAHRLPGHASTISAPAEGLDLATVIGVSQAVSGEIVLEKLLDIVMRKAMEHAGAERGLLIVPQGDDLQVRVESTTRGSDVIARLTVASESATALPESVLRHVTRTHESVILDDASSASQFSADPYLLRGGVRSVLCLPLIAQSKLTGVLYLENNLASHVFTSERVTVLRVLASQAAISLENTRLYRDLEQMRQLESDLAHMNRLSMLGELTASLAHEVKQPIATARNNARAAENFLKMRPPELDEVKEAVRCIVGDVDRAGAIIDRVSEQIKKTPPRKDRFDLNAAINEVIELARGKAGVHGVLVKTQLAVGLLPVQGDRVQLQQVILNLILNAVEAMGSIEGETRELLIGTERDHTGALVAVYDSGPGIPPKDLERVFQSFYTTKPAGTGMGLSVCRSIINAHGGRLWAEANAPRGAVFRFFLPADPTA